MDPLAEYYDNVSPYNYVLNNPINFTDPDGTMVDEGPAGFRSTVIDEKGKIIKHDGTDGDNSVYQMTDGKKVKIGTEKAGVDYNYLIGKQMTANLFNVDPWQLNQVEIKGVKNAGISLPIAFIGEPGLVMSYPVENILPGTRLIAKAANVLSLILEMSSSQGKGERRQTGSADGTDNPFKKLKPDPKKPGNVLEKNSHTGKTVSKPAPPGFWEWWKSK